MRSLVLSLLFVFVSIFSNAAITSLTLSTSMAQDCDSVVVSISGTHTCPNDFITNISHTVVGSIITVNLTVLTGICIPPIPTPTFSTTYTINLSAVPIGNYTVRGMYNSIMYGTTPALQVISCCPFNASAGNDTSFCDVSNLQLNGNTPPVGATSSWSVFSGGGTLTNGTMPNATVSSMSYGSNRLVWTVTDTACTTTDTVTITNYEPVSTASTEADRTACEDTSTLHAIAPTVGKGKWKSLTTGAVITNVNQPNCNASFIFPGTYKFSWTVTNGLCQSSDTLVITYAVLDSAPVITELNKVLTSSSAPQYQWYLDGNPISGATSMTHTATVNGTYKVLASVAGCSTGMFSNEIEITTVGFDEILNANEISLVPNPTKDFLKIYSNYIISRIEIMDINGKIIEYYNLKNVNKFELDVSGLDPAVYLIRIIGSDVVIKRLIIQ